MSFMDHSLVSRSFAWKTGQFAWLWSMRLQDIHLANLKVQIYEVIFSDRRVAP